MIPSLSQIIDAHRFLNQSFDLKSVPDPALLELTRQEAITLATTEASEPAALFFAFSRRARALGDAWRLLPDLLAIHQARSLGKPLGLNHSELKSMRVDIARQALTFEQIRERLR